MSMEDRTMSTAEKTPAIPPELLVELEEAVDEIMKGVRDPEKMDRAAREMDEGREEIRQRLGELNLAVELVREARSDTIH
jgi:hypothetical protein